MTERPLTRLLARWADARRLTTPQAEAIRRTIMASPVTATPEALGFEWWWHLLDPVAGAAFRGSRGSEALPVLAAGASLPAQTWSMGRPDLPELADVGTWHPDVADYQPYLRLAIPAPGRSR